MGTQLPSPKGFGERSPLPNFRPMSIVASTAGWIKMPLGMEVDLGPGHIVLDRDPAPLSKRGTAPSFRSISVVAKWLDGPRCHLVGGRPQPKQHCVRWGPNSPPPNRDRPTIFVPCLLWPNGWMDEDVTWYGTAQATLC